MKKKYLIDELGEKFTPITLAESVYINNNTITDEFITKNEVVNYVDNDTFNIAINDINLKLNEFLLETDVAKTLAVIAQISSEPKSVIIGPLNFIPNFGKVYLRNMEYDDRGVPEMYDPWNINNCKATYKIIDNECEFSLKVTNKLKTPHDNTPPAPGTTYYAIAFKAPFKIDSIISWTGTTPNYYNNNYNDCIIIGPAISHLMNDYFTWELNFKCIIK